MTDKKVAARLEELRTELRAARISYGELAELQGLVEHIEPGDVELLEAAGVPEYPNPDPLVSALSPDEASDLMLALSEVIDRHGKNPESDDEREQIARWQALSERIDRAGDWEVID